MNSDASKSASSPTLNDLPRFSPWPARLLGIESWTQRHKTPAEIIREFECEKWGRLLARVRAANHPVTVKEADAWWFEGIEPSLCSIEKGFVLLSPTETHRRYVNLVANAIASFAPSPALVELGAGYGSVLLALAEFPKFYGMQLVAGEFTASGVDLIKSLGKAQGIEVSAGYCDLASKPIARFTVPEDAVVFTSYAIPYVPKLPTTFVEAMLALNPRVVIHFEPCYEHCETTSLIGLMRRRYLEVNDYNTNLLTLLRDEQRRGRIKILVEEPAVFGANPLLAVSIVAWSPNL